MPGAGAVAGHRRHDNADVSAVPFGDLVKVRGVCRLINGLKDRPLVVRWRYSGRGHILHLAG